MRFGRIFGVMCGLALSLAGAWAQNGESQWFDFVMPWDDAVPGTATDVSSLSPAPAGKDGFVQVKNGQFVNPKTGKRIRFFGTNCGARTAFPSKVQADKMAARMRKLGINLVRLHHLNNGWDLDGGTIWKQGRTYIEIDPVQVDKLDYFIAALIRNGIYVNINLQTAREMIPELGFPDSVTQIPDFQKKVDKFDAHMIELQHQYAKDLLDRINPYLGRKYKDEPGVLIVEINNENSLLGWPGESPGSGLSTLPEPFRGDLKNKWNQWLLAKYQDDAGLAKAWPSSEDFTGPSIVNSSSQWNYENQGNADVQWELMAGSGSAGTAPTLKVTLPKYDGPSWHIQTNISGLDLENGKPYTVRFKAKADREMKLEISSRLDQSDWRFLGLGDTFTVGTQEKTYTYTFIVSNTLPHHSRIGFVLGGPAGQVTFSDFSVRPGTVTVGLLPGESAQNGTVEFRSPAPARPYWDYVRFLADLEVAYDRGFRTLLGDQLGFKNTYLYHTQVQWGGVTSLEREQPSAYADTHGYWNHPNFYGAAWDPENYTVQRTSMVDVIGETGGELANIAYWRTAGKPFSVTEYNHPSPCDFESEMMPLYSSMAAFQDWDSIYCFDYGPIDPTAANDSFSGYFDTGRNPAKAAFFPATAIIFRKQLIDPGTVATLFLPRDAVNTSPFVQSHWNAASESAMPKITQWRVQVAQGTTDQAQIRLPKNVPITPISVVDGNGGKVYRVDSPKAKVVSGFLGGTIQTLGKVRFKIDPFGFNHGSVMLVPLDGETVEASERLLLTVAGRVENTGMQWNADRNSVGTHWGTGPTRAEWVPLTVSLVNPRVEKVYALDGSGRRVREVPVNKVTGAIQFTIGQNAKSLWFEIVGKKYTRLPQ
ncbi:MAG: cellulase family glycosylhydrolase [Armatimonadetes bacterium]|nr:cellulase family glycosylhydrolase [Armatimonadota bacterium]